MLFCVQMQLKRLLYVSKLAVWAGLEPAIRNFSRRVMELKSRLELESSHLELLYLSYFNTARCITILRTTHPNKSKTRLKWQFFFNVLNNQEDCSIITIFNLVCCCRVFKWQRVWELHPTWISPCGYEPHDFDFQSNPQSTHSCFQHLQSACLKARCRAWPKDLVQHSSAPNDAKPPIINYRFSKSFLNELSHSINKAYYIISKRSVNKNFKKYSRICLMKP